MSVFSRTLLLAFTVIVSAVPACPVRARRKDWPIAVVAVLIEFAALSGARAQLFIDMGHVSLESNLAGQAVDLFVENTGAPLAISGLSFNIQVADSGPASQGGLGVIDGPDITGIDLLTGSVFAGNHTSPQDAGSIPQFLNWTVTTSSGAIILEKGIRYKLASITFDTTGFHNGTWDLSVGETLNGPTKFFQINGPNVTDLIPYMHDGGLTVTATPVPEPAESAFLAALVLAGLVVVHARSLRRSPQPTSRQNDAQGPGRVDPSLVRAAISSVGAKT